MAAIEAQTGVAALLDHCAQLRAGEVLPFHTDDSARLNRAMQAEAAGRELLTALIRPEPWPDLSLGATIRRMISYLQTVISASTPETELAPMLNVRAHHVDLNGETARLLRDAALCLVLAAYDDGAQDVDLLVEKTEGGARLVVESSRPAITTAHPALIGLRAHVAALYGTWDDRISPHGRTWIVAITLPSSVAIEVRQ